MLPGRGAAGLDQKEERLVERLTPTCSVDA